MKNLILQRILPARVCELLQSIGRAADGFGTQSYLVGGMVRDMLHGSYSTDVDVVLEGDTLAFAQFLKCRWGDYFKNFAFPEKQVAFKRYKTAKLHFSGEVVFGIDVLDFASARCERYPKPGGAPEVFPGKLQEDLGRRDFSINAIAVDLNENSFGEVRDYFDGINDIETKILRVLHSRSFIDDPARLIRGLRFCSRLGFEFDRSTNKLFLEATQSCLLQTLPKFRLFDEFRKALCEKQPVSVLRELDKRVLLSQIIPEVKLTKELEQIMEFFCSDCPEVIKKVIDAGGKQRAEKWLLLLGVLFRNLPDDAYRAFLERHEVHERLIKHALLAKKSSRAY